MMDMKRFNKKGQVISELLVVGGLFSLIFISIMGLVLDSYRATTGGEEDTYATFLAQEGLDAARAIRDDAWLNLVLGDHGLSRSSGFWEFSGISDSIGKYTRVITIEQVNRVSPYGNINTSGGTTYGRIKKVTATITWTTDDINRSVNAIAYFNDWNVFDWFQDSSPQFLAGTFDHAIASGTGSGADIILDTTQEWTNAAGYSFEHGTAADFENGTFANTTLIRSVIPTHVDLATSTSWGTFTSPTNQDLNEVYLSSINDGWAVGASGKILRWNGISWSEFLDTGATTHNTLHMVSSTDGWIAGTSGKIFRWNGTTWSEFTDTGNQSWNGLYFVSSTDGWVVGSGGEIRRWNGTSWSSVTSPTIQDLNSVHMVSATDGWAAGGSGVILRWNGTSWSLFVDTGNETWNDVYMVSATDGWAVGSGGAMRRWDGTAWNAVTSPIVDAIYSIHMVSATDGWAVSISGQLLFWNGTSWSLSTDTGNQIWSSIYMVSSGDGWVVGVGGVIYRYSAQYAASGTFLSTVFDSGTFGSTWNSMNWTENLQVGTDLTIAVRTGPTATPDGSWSSFSTEYTNPAGETFSTTPNNQYFQYRVTLTTSNPSVTSEFRDITVFYNAPTGQHLNDVSMVSNSEGWAVANSGVIIYWDGSVWSATTSPVADNLNSVEAVSSSDVWAVGANGIILRRTGTSWGIQTDTGTDTWNDIDIFSSTLGFVVGNAGHISQWNGLAWVPAVPPTTQNLYSVWIASATDAWAVGDSGKIMRWDGLAWTQFVDTGNQIWRRVIILSSTDGWVVGDAGVIYRWNGTSWSSFVSPTSQDLRGLDFIATNNGWAVGVGGVILRWDGSSWSSFASPTSALLNAVDQIDNKNAWSVGNGGAIIRYRDLFATVGTFISSVLDTGTAVNRYFQSIFWSEVIPPGTDILVSTRSGNMAVPDASWTTFSSESSVATGTPILSPDARYIQYQVILLTNDTSTTSQLHDITITYK